MNQHTRTFRSDPKFLFFFLLLLSITVSPGQNTSAILSGRILDEKNQPLAFATIYEAGTTNGTTSNQEGNYQLIVSSGSKTIIVQYIGYQKMQKTLRIDGETTLNFQLKPEALVLREVTISAQNKDPSYRIIREAMKKRKLYENEVHAYACEVYIKGVERLDKKPGSLLGMAITIDTGIVYLSESVSHLKFERPNKINERVISSKVSGNSSSFSYNQASQMMINLYESQFFVEGLSERPFISPLSGNAFLYYDFRLAGTFQEDTLLINKIQLLPRRPTDPVFKGFIYIIEGSWRIHSVDAFLTRDNGIEFIDSLTFKQVFAPTDLGIWMPLSQRFTFKFSAYGFRGSGYYTGTYKNYEIEPNYSVYRLTVPQEKEEKVKEERKDLFKKEDFKKAILVVEEEANKRDSLYWATIRPVPLTALEVQDYKIKQEIQQIKDSAPYKDSLDRILNKPRLANFFVNGYTFADSKKETYYNFPTIQQILQYNTVEGFVPELKVSYLRQKERKTFLRITPKVKYGFSNHRLQAMIDWRYRKTFKNPEYLYGNFGYYSLPLNQKIPIDPFVNTVYTLALGENYQKLVQNTFLSAGYQRELVNGLLLNTKFTYAYRTPLFNTTDFTIFNARDFTPNNPTNLELTDTSFDPHRTFTLDVLLRIRINQKYLDRPEEKIYLESSFPDLYLNYSKGIPALGAEINYDLLSVAVKKEGIKLGLLGASNLSLEAGKFLNTSTMTFLDFKHFNGNQTIIRQLQLENRFQVLDYYTFSTNDQFFEGHLEHHFNEFIFNKIPWIKKFNLQSVASVNYLSTSQGQFLELGAGIEHIFRFFRIDYFVGLQNGQHAGQGIRLGFGF